MDEMRAYALSGFSARTKSILTVPEETVTCWICPGQDADGCFAIDYAGEEPFLCFITSSDTRMECLSERIKGEERNVFYRVHGSGLQDGEEIKGEWTLVANSGEYRIPFLIKAKDAVLESSQGEWKNLQEFALFAKKNFSEAARLFVEGKVERILTDPYQIICQRGLREGRDRQHGLEEFLLATGQKQPVSFFTPVEQPEVVCREEETRLLLPIVRNGWGYTALKIRITGKFIKTEKELLTEDDFVGSQCELTVLIRKEELHGGRNFGQIELTDGFSRISIPILAMREEERDEVRQEEKAKERNRQKVMIRLMRLYIGFRLYPYKEGEKKTCLKEAEKLIAGLVDGEELDVEARLYQAHLFILQERYQEAEWVLKHCREEIEQNQQDWPEIYAYMLYLNRFLTQSGQAQEETDEWQDAEGEIRRLYRMHSDSWRIAWMYLCIGARFTDRRRQGVACPGWDLLLNQYRQGGYSPLLYLEALRYLNEDPSLLRKIGKFELQVLFFGSKYHALSKELVAQLAYTAGMVREKQPLLLEALKNCYRKEESDDLLREICSQLIKGGNVRQEAFEWYKRGLEKDLRLTKLYEYYMMSVPRRKDLVLDKKALYYFSYENTLNREQTAFLYCYVLKHKEELGELYNSYRDRMWEFAREQFGNMRMNPDLAGLYRAFLKPEEMGERELAIYSRIGFAFWFQTKEEKIRRVLCYDNNLAKCRSYPLSNGKAWLPIYEKDTLILLEDEDGKYYRKRIPYTLERLMSPDEAVFLCDPDMEGLDPDFLAVLWKRQTKQEELSDAVLRCGCLLTESMEYTQPFRQGVYPRLLRELEKRKKTGTYRFYLETLQPASLSRQNRERIFSLLVEVGLYNRALEWIKILEPEYLPADSLGLLLEQVLTEDSDGQDKAIRRAAENVWQRGICPGSVLRYLAKNGRGSLEKLFRIRKLCVEKEKEGGIFKEAFCPCTDVLSERMLVQALFTGGGNGQVTGSCSTESGCEFADGRLQEVFRSFYRRCPESPVVSWFCRYSAREYLLRNRLPDGLVFTAIGNRARESEKAVSQEMRGENLLPEEKLAFLKYYAEVKRQAEEETQQMLEEFLLEMLNRGIVMKCFLTLPVREELLIPLKDKQILEYYGEEKEEVFVYYRISSRQDGGEYRRREMKESVPGMYFAKFVLFYGEKLDYYIAVEKDSMIKRMDQGSRISQENQTARDSRGGERDCEIGRQRDRAGQIVQEEKETIEDCSYERLNDILIAQELEEWEEMDRLILEYVRRQKIAQEVFSIL